MLELHLKTIARRPDGCYSVLCALEDRAVEARPFAVALERTFENLRTVLGAGRYPCLKTRYYRGGYDTFEIIVPGHERVLFHRGNVETHSKGCVLVGERFGLFGEHAGVADSAKAFDEFWRLTKDRDAFDLAVFR